MKKLLLSLSVVFVLFGCTTDENNDNEGSENATQENQSLEEQIKNIVKENSYNPKDIVDYDLKGNYIYVYSYSTRNGLTSMLIKNNSNGLEWVTSWVSIQTSSLGHKGTAPIVTIIQPEDTDVKDVRVFGKPAKLTQTTIEFTEDFSQEVKFWVYYSDNKEEVLDGFDEDIEYIK
ncbi:hypothetical protein SAMN05216232_3575 [Virgibacillus subterraneus]|uniref:Lipoprotein n=1 Tax=Virgibacillus subterraneus TaxID=621109 RepID=A0A1H9JPJ0_9BACI|nr:hypothetical protein [Virgibacillus subterraneus]SEQ88726.1 hypothetical protein SAMN05216232_3575 [Virgibacillus subterraneus]